MIHRVRKRLSRADDRPLFAVARGSIEDSLSNAGNTLLLLSNRDLAASTSSRLRD